MTTTTAQMHGKRTMPDEETSEWNSVRTSKALEMRLDACLAHVKAEIFKAMSKHPPMHGPHEGWSVIWEELDELWDHVKADTGRSPKASKEAMQVACTAVRYMLDVCDA